MDVVVDPLGDQREDVELAVGELRERSGRARPRRAWASSVTACASAWSSTTSPAATARRACSTRSRPGALDEVAAGAVAQRGQRRVVVLRHRQHHDPHLGMVLGEPAVDLQPGAVGRGGRRAARTSGAASRDQVGTWSARCASPTSSMPSISLDRRRQAHAEHRVVVDDGDPQRRPRSLTAAPPGGGRGRGCRAGGWAATLTRCRRARRPARASPSARRRRRSPSSMPTPSSTTSMSTVGPVDDRQPAARGAGVAHDVGHRLGDDAVGRHLDRGRQLDRRGRQGEVDLERRRRTPRVNSATASTRPSWSSAVGRRSRTIRLTSTTSGVDLVGDAARAARGPGRARSASGDALELADRGAQPERHAGQRRARARRGGRAAAAAAPPRAPTRSPRSTGAGRRPGAPSRRPGRAARRARSRISLVAVAQRRAVAPSRRRGGRRPRRAGRARRRARASVGGPMAAPRCQPSGDAHVDGHGVEAQLALQAGDERRQQVVAGVGADVVDDAADDGQRVVAGAVHEAVDERAGRAGGPARRRRRWRRSRRRAATSGRCRRRAGRARRRRRCTRRRCRRPGRPTPADPPWDDAVERDPGVADAPRRSRRRRAAARSRAAKTAARRRRAREPPARRVEARRDDGQPGRDGAGRQPARQRVVGAATRRATTPQQGGRRRGRRRRRPRGHVATASSQVAARRRRRPTATTRRATGGGRPHRLDRAGRRDRGRSSHGTSAGEHAAPRAGGPSDRRRRASRQHRGRRCRPT